MNRRRFLSSVSAAALLAALPLPVVMGRAAKAAFNPKLSCVHQGRTFFVVAGQEQTLHWVKCEIFDEWKAAGIPVLERKSIYDAEKSFKAKRLA